MRLVVNGEAREVEATSLAALLEALDYGEANSRPPSMAPSYPSGARDGTPLKDGDRIEILAPRQGG